jgi:aconitate decarboxylase
MNSTDALSEFAAGLSLSDIPIEVREHAKLSVLDTVGCGLFGSTLEWTAILRRGLSAPHAALVNGTAVHAFELDDLHPRSIVHVGCVTLPAAVAAGEHAGVESGERLLTAIVAGYEVAARVGMSMGARHLVAGWHPTGTHGTFAAAAAAGVMLGLDAGAMADALGIAASQSAGLMASQYGSMVKRFHAGRAAQSGVYAALLAAEGFAGIEDVLEAPYGGYCTTMAPSYDASALTAGLGSTWETAQVGFKPYPTNGSCHPSIDALLALRAEHGVAAADVAGVLINVSSATKHHVGWAYRPVSVTAAQMNLPYIAAAVITDGAATVEQFSEARIRDPELLALSRRVEVVADPEIDARGDGARHATRLQLRLADGRVLSAAREFAHGSARDPLTRGDVEDKYRFLAAQALPEARVDRLRGLVAELEHGSASQLAGALLP